MARIIINIIQRTPRRPCRIDVRMDGSSRDTVAERNLMEEIFTKLREKWSVGGIDYRRAEGGAWARRPITAWSPPCS